jgi:transcriptional regulator with XRE-family HTH domain
MGTMNWKFDRARLTTLRDLKGFSTEQMAEIIGKTGESYRLKEKGAAPLTVDELAAIASELSVQPGAFFVQPDESVHV